MRNILVIRFGSLGDLCLLGWTLARYRDAGGVDPGPGPDRVTLVTKPAYAPLLRHCRGVDEVIAPVGTSALEVVRLARRLGRQHWDRVVDAHSVLRGHLLLSLMGRRPDARLQKDTAARLAYLGFGRQDRKLQRTMGDRFDSLFCDDGSRPAALAQRLPSGGLPPLGELNSAAAPTSAVLGLAPGAQWLSKRWPENNFADLCAGYLERHTGTIRLFLGPQEERWYQQGPLAKLAAAEARLEVVRNQSLPEVAESLASCRLVVTNDSGLLHLAEAVSTPVLAFFGPTVREFGYFPRLPASRVLELDLECRPCSRNGKRPCHRGDLACLQGIGVDEVLAEIEILLDLPGEGGGV